MRVLETGETIPLEETIVQSDGSQAIMLTNKSPLYDETGKIVGLLGTSTDITERKRMEADLVKVGILAEAVRAKTEFIENMSHDIRTPITGILGMIQDLLYAASDLYPVLRSEKPLTTFDLRRLLQDLIERIAVNMNTAERSIQELLQFCNEILEVAWLETGEARVEPESFDLYHSVQHTVDLLKSVASNKKLSLLVEVDENVPRYLSGLHRYLSRSLLNLTANALKFTDTGFVKIRVGLENEAKQSYQKGDPITLRIQVEDTGIGIPKDKFEVIFEHFSRLTPSYKGTYKGSGLGLYTVKRYIAAMKGSIGVDSEEGKGSCFTLTLPLRVDDHADQSTTEEVPVLIRHSASQWGEILSTAKTTTKTTAKTAEVPNEVFSNRVLLVEDNPVAAKAAEIPLRSFHCAVDWVSSGEEAVEKAEKETYQLVLMDVGLPKMSGIDATKAIRALPDPIKSNVWIVALTGHAGEGTRQECLEAGMNAVLNKPATPEKMRSILQQLQDLNSESG